MNNINLGEALSLLKKEQSRLSRLITLRKENTLIEEGTTPSFNPKDLGEKINNKIDGIRKLKIRIQKTNLNTNLIDDNISLAEAIIKVNDIRSKIAQLSGLFERKKNYWYSEKEQKVFVSQLNESDIEDEIEKLELEKSQLDNKIQMTNWKMELK